MERGRFSLLLLDPGEIFFEDFAAVLVTTDTTIRTFDRKKLDGRLHLCSRSLVFEPSNVARPLVKIPYRECDIIERWNGSRQFIDGDDVFRVECRQHVEMLERNIVAPYRFRDGGKFIVSLTYASVAHCLTQIMQLKRASTLSPIEHNDMIATIVHSRHSRTSFDPMWLDLYEKIESETQGNRIAPLVVNPGRIVLSTSRLYFQPYNNVESPVTKIDISSVQRILKRRFLLRHIGLEIYYRTGDKETHIYLSFLNRNDREELYDKLVRHPELKLSDDDQEVMTLKWQNGIISNYDYLLYVNSLGDRTKNDLTQYPVFPWIILDYTSETLDLSDRSIYRDLSLPMGAVNKDRLTKLMERFDEMPEPKFIYGSHYSTPGFVLFYLVRLYPEYMLCLQNGRFDHPDRMFNSAARLCRNALNDMSDFKELIPEFYDVEQDGLFLVNSRGINFGHRHDNVKVNDVELPPWAKSPGHFVRMLREALESEYVSSNLHNWIDLIFGYKQRGEEALKAHNLYYYLCYEGGVDLDAITDLNRRHTLEVQIMEFGQIPKQVFKVPHPRRRPKEPIPFELSVGSTLDKENEGTEWTTLVQRTTFSAHKNVVEDVLVAEDCDRVISVGHDAKMKVFSVSQDRQIRSAAIGSMRLSCCVKLPDLNLLLIATYANEIVVYDLDFGRVERTVRAHDDSITCLLWVPGLNVLFSGSNDFNVCMWRGVETETSIRPVEYVMRHFDHESHVRCLSFDRVNERLAVGTGDGEICIWKLGDCVPENKFPAHSDVVTAMDYSADGLKLVSCSLDRSFQVLDINTGLSLYRKSTEAPMTCLKWDVVLLIGSDDGRLHVWDMLEVKPLQEIRAHQGPIMSVDISRDKKIVVTGGGDSLVKVWSPN